MYSYSLEITIRKLALHVEPLLFTAKIVSESNKNEHANTVGEKSIPK